MNFLPPIEYYAYTSLFTAVLTLCMAVITLFKANEVFYKRLFGYGVFATFAWTFFYFLWQIESDPFMAEFYLRTLMLPVPFIPVCFFHFTVEFLFIPFKRWMLVVLYGMAIIFAVTVYSDFYAHTLEPFLNMPYWLDAGPIFSMAVAFFHLVYGAMYYMAWKASRRFDERKRKQMMWVFWGIFIGTAGGGTNFFGWYNIPVPPVLNIGPSLFCLPFVYAIARYKFLDIKIFIRRGLIYSLSVSAATIIFLLTVFTLEGAFRDILQYESQTASIIAVVLIALLFTPIQNRIRYMIDHLFFKGSSAEIAEQNEMLRQQLTQSEKYKLLSVLSEGIVDRIKDPLTTLNTYAHFLEKKKGDEAFISKLQGVLKREVQRIDDLLQNLRDYTSSAPMAKKETNVVWLIDNALFLLKDDLERKNIRIIKDSDPDFTVMVLVDPVHIRQVFIKIFQNAVEAMEPNGLLAIGFYVDDNECHIYVNDNGEGIAPEHRKRIFDPFFSTKGKGRGMGLAIAQAIVDSHKGEIRLNSRRHQDGTEIVVTLPCIRKPQAALKPVELKENQKHREALSELEVDASPQQFSS